MYIVYIRERYFLSPPPSSVYIRKVIKKFDLKVNVQKGPLRFRDFFWTIYVLVFSIHVSSIVTFIVVFCCATLHLSLWVCH